MATNHTSGQERQLHLPWLLRDSERGPVDVTDQLFKAPAEPRARPSERVSTLRDDVATRIHGSVSHRRKASVPPKSVKIDRNGAFELNVNFDAGGRSVLSFEVRGNVVTERVQSFAEAGSEAEAWHYVKAIKFGTILRYRDHGYDEPAFAADARMVERAVRDALLDKTVEDIESARAAASAAVEPKRDDHAEYRHAASLRPDDHVEYRQVA